MSTSPSELGDWEVVCMACGHQWQLRHPLTNQRPADPAEAASAMECGVCPKCGYGHIAVCAKVSGETR